MASEDYLKQQVEDLQKQLGKKQKFEENRGQRQDASKWFKLKLKTVIQNGDFK